MGNCWVFGGVGCGNFFVSAMSYGREFCGRTVRAVGSGVSSPGSFALERLAQRCCAPVGMTGIVVRSGLDEGCIAVLRPGDGSLHSGTTSK